MIVLFLIMSIVRNQNVKTLTNAKNVITEVGLIVNAKMEKIVNAFYQNLKLVKMNSHYHKYVINVSTIKMMMIKIV